MSDETIALARKQIDHWRPFLNADIKSLLRDVDTICDSHELLRAERDTLRDELTDWILVADGVKHDWRCTQDARTGGDGSGLICLRCQLEQAEARLTEARDRIGVWREAAQGRQAMSERDSDSTNARIEEALVVAFSRVLALLGGARIAQE